MEIGIILLKNLMNLMTNSDLELLIATYQELRMKSSRNDGSKTGLLNILAIKTKCPFLYRDLSQTGILNVVEFKHFARVQRNNLLTHSRPNERPNIITLGTP